MPGQITAFDIGECMVKAACFTGGKLKKGYGERTAG